MLMPLLYAGLAGTVLALIVATRQQNWSLRVLMLLGLRLAIGWHFLFEGLHKLHTHEVGATDSNPRVFTSKPYFDVAPGPLGSFMRKKFETGESPEDRLKLPKEIGVKEFNALTIKDQAEYCPASVAKALDELAAERKADIIKSIEAEADAAIKSADNAVAKPEKDANDFLTRAAAGKLTQAELDVIHAKAEQDRTIASAKADALRDQARSRNKAFQSAGEELKKQLGGMTADAIQKELEKQRGETDKQIKAITDDEKKSLEDIHQTEQRWATGKLNDADTAKVKAAAAKETETVRENTKKARAAAVSVKEKPEKAFTERVEDAKQKFAAWAVGAVGRPVKLKGFAQDADMTGPQRLEHIAFLRKRVEEAEERLKTGLGNGLGIDQKKAAEFRMDLVAAEADLRKDVDALVAEVKKDVLGTVKPADASPAELSEGQKMDRITMWFLIAVGGCIMAGLFTRIACLAGVGFLVLTYLTHPPFPWFPLPPNTEGNPVFINKNIIEALALLVLATYPTGRWLGVDALIARVCGCRRNWDIA